MLNDRGRRAGSAAGVFGASAGVLAAGVLATLTPRFPFPPVVVAERVAQLTPGGVASFFIDRLQHRALPLTVVLTTVVLALVSAGLGALLPRLVRILPLRLAATLLSVPPFMVGLLTFAPSDVTVTWPMYALGLGACTVVGAVATTLAYRRITGGRLEQAASAPAEAGVSRRTLLQASVVGGAGMLLGWAQLGRVLFPRPNPGRNALVPARLTRVREPASAPGDAAFDRVLGLSSRITAAEDFYVVDEEIIDPDIDPVAWRLSVSGIVDRPFEVTYDELLAMSAVEQDTTLECISNPVGGDLISTARWTGVPLPALLARAGPRTGALEVVARAVGGYSDSISIEDAQRPDTLVAIGMNGNALPREHGFPARLLAPRYYGMKQPKWLTSLEVVDAPYRGYWENRGWVKAAVVKTMSRVDTVERTGGGWVIAGVAFAGDRRIERVEVSLDGGASWQEARLETALSRQTWRRWLLPLGDQAPESAVVRATDGSGMQQTSQVAPPHPDGASGYHEVVV